MPTADRQPLTAASGLRIAPNPAAGYAAIAYSVPKTGDVSLKLYDVTGKLVRTLVNGYHLAGVASLIVDCSSLPEGAYQLVLRAGNGEPAAARLTLR